MKSYCLLPWLICVLLTGCISSGLAAVRPKMEVEISNQSSQALDNALVGFGDYQCKWGHIGRTFSASYMYYPYPVTAAAELHWDEEGKHRMEKLDLSKVYQRGKSGRLTFTVYDGRVEVRFVERK